MALDLQEILAGGKPRITFSKKRHTEQVRRSASAQGKARTALTYLHPDEYRELYVQAIAAINAERGPLPD